MLLQHLIPEEHIQKIDEFVNELNNNPQTDSMEYDPAFILTVRSLIKVNKMGYGRNCSASPKVTAGQAPKLWKRVKTERKTILYTLNPDPESSKYTIIDVYGDRMIPFNPSGHGSYQVYKCKHGETLRIGYFVRICTPLSSYCYILRLVAFDSSKHLLRLITGKS